MGPRRYNNYSSKSEIKIITEITPPELVTQLLPLDIPSFSKQIETKRDLFQRRREIFAKIVPLTDSSGKRILKSYEINKLCNEEPILPLEHSVEIIETKLKEFNKARKKPRFQLLLDKMDDDNDNTKDDINEKNDEEKQSESEDSSESEVEKEDSVDEYGDDHSSEEDNDEY